MIGDNPRLRTWNSGDFGWRPRRTEFGGTSGLLAPAGQRLAVTRRGRSRFDKRWSPGGPLAGLECSPGCRDAWCWRGPRLRVRGPHLGRVGRSGGRAEFWNPLQFRAWWPFSRGFRWSPGSGTGNAEGTTHRLFVSRVRDGTSGVDRLVASDRNADASCVVAWERLVE